MPLFQRFRHDGIIEALAVRKSADGAIYSLLDDITETFPGALQFKIDGVILNFLRDEHEQIYEPKKIAHYPDYIIDVITTAHASSPFASQNSDSDGTILLSAQDPSSHASSTSQALARIPQYPANQLLAQPMASLSSIASDTTRVQQQLDHSAHQHLDPIQHALEHLHQMIRSQAESKERELHIIAELAAAKERDEEMHRMQKQTIDRLVVAQQRIEAILVQNYELHEYPTPRMFVILPDSYTRWDPCNSLEGRFRLYFLCECGDHCNEKAVSSGQLTIATAISTASFPVKNSIHLAKHEGYELSRPIEFFDRYGHYVLGMLRILKHYLAVATVLAPAVALTESSVKDIMDGVKSNSENTMEAVDMSIDFLQQRLGYKPVPNGVNGSDVDTQDEDMFSGLAALKGADLRQLDAFLRKTDADKVLGNLYKITLETGHVKWVCFEHYKQVYRETAMSSFVQTVETNRGRFDPQLGKVTISLTSGTSAKDFFSRLSKQASSVRSLSVTLDWSFASADLVMLVDKISQSNVSDLELDLQNDDQPPSIVSQIRLDKGRYHSLLGLLSNTKIKNLVLSNVAFIGSRTSSLPTSQSPSLLQSLHYLGKIHSTDDSRLANIVSHCPELVELKLGSQASDSEGVPKIDQAIGSLSKLKVLHRYKLYPSFPPGIYAPPSIDHSPYGSGALQELVECGLFYYCQTPLLEGAIQRSSATLEVLLLDFDRAPAGYIDLISPSKMLPSTSHTGDPSLFSRLTCLSLYVGLPPNSLNLMAAVLPGLPLVHLGVDVRTSGLLAYVNPSTLKSLSVRSMAKNYSLEHLCRAISLPSQIETLELGSIPVTQDLLEALEAIPLQRLDLDGIDGSALLKVLSNLNVSQLQVLTLSGCKYDGRIDLVFTTKFDEFLNGFVFHRKVGREGVHDYKITKNSEGWQAL